MSNILRCKECGRHCPHSTPFTCGYCISSTVARKRRRVVDQLEGLKELYGGLRRENEDYRRLYREVMIAVDDYASELKDENPMEVVPVYRLRQFVMRIKKSFDRLPKYRD